MTTTALINAAARHYKAGNLPAAKEAIELAQAEPDAADHLKRIRAARDILVQAGAFDRCWIPDTSYHRRCPATDSACPAADKECASNCALIDAGWPIESPAQELLL